MKDLFGNEINETMPRPHHGYKLLKHIRQYRLSDSKTRRCKFCRHRVQVWGNTRQYHKCRLIGITSSEATDIRLRNVCILWDMEVNTMEEFERWYFAEFTEDQNCHTTILRKVNELYENAKKTD